MANTSRYIALAVAILISGFLLYLFSDIVGYVLIAWVLSLIGQPLMSFFQKHVRFGQYKVGPTLSSVLTLVSIITVFVVIFWLFVPILFEQALTLADFNYDAVSNALNQPLTALNNKLESLGLIKSNTQHPAEQLRETFSNWFEPSDIGNVFGSLISTASYLIFAIFSIIFITFFFLKEQGLFVNFLVAVAPDQYEVEVRHGLESITELLTRYFTGVLIQITIITVFVSAFLSLLGVNNPLIIGFFAAVVNVIPYLGPIIGAAFGALLTISSSEGQDFYLEVLPLLTKVGIVFAAVQLLDNFLLQPFIFSKSVMAHPLEIFIVVLIAAKLGGITGMILAIPGYTILRVIAWVFLREFKIVQKLTGGIEQLNTNEMNENLTENK